MADRLGSDRLGAMVGLAVLGLAAASSAASADASSSLRLDAVRAASLAEGAIAGHDGKFHLGSADGDWRLDISGLIQFRYVATVFNAPSGGEDFVHGFERRRTRVKFDAQIGSPAVKASVQVDFNRTTGISRIIDASAAFDLGDGLTLHAGQMMAPFSREYQVSNTRQLAMERSIIAQRALPISDGRAIGLLAEYEADNFRVQGMVTGGSESVGTSYDEQADSALAARAELRFGGTWGQFNRFSARRGSDAAVLLGAAVWTEHPTRDAFTADITYQHDGLSAYAAVFFSDIEAFEPEQIWGWTAHVGYAVTETFEPYARYEWAATDSGEADLSVASAGFNYYIAGSAVRLVTDVSYSFEPMVSRWRLSNAGWLIDDAGEDGQAIFKLMLQVLF